MDVLRPSVVWISGRCYRLLSESNQSARPADDQSSYVKLSIPSYPEIVEAEDLTSCADFEACDADFAFETLGNGELKTLLEIPNAYFGNIIGAKGATKKRLEAETRTRVRIPRMGEEGDIVVIGGNKRDLASARTRIEVIVNSARQKEPFTHFLSIPLTDPAVQNGFLDFRADVLRECDETRGVSSSLFQSPQKLHITIGTMALLDNRERQKAAKLLAECNEDIVKPILDGEPLRLRVAGLEYMNDDPAEVDVLYAQVESADGSDKLQILADQLVDRFVTEGVMQRQYERVKLHATVMNTMFREKPSQVIDVNPRGNKSRETFDASVILQIFEGYVFGEMRVPALHISLRHSTGKDGFYLPSTKQDLI